MNLNITDASGRSWFFTLLTDRFSTIGRAPDNDVVLFDPLVSRHHAFIKYEDGFFVLVDGVFVNGQIKRSANHILVNGTQCYERRLNHGDQITIGKSTLRFELRPDDSCNMAIPPSESIVLQAVNIPQKIHLEPISTLQAEAAIKSAAIAKASTRSGEQDTLAASDVVDCTVFAPPCINMQFEASFMVQVFANLFEQAEAVKNLAKEFDESAERRACKGLETEIERGSKLTFHLSMPNLEVTDPIQTLTWRGRPDAVQFVVNIPPGVIGGNEFGTVTISQDSVPIGQVSFTLKLSFARSSKQPEITGEASVYKKAFISYASPDRNEVLKRVQMLARLHVNFFQDLLNLEPGQRWERELYRHIDESDMFLLFWSSAAKASNWVMEEVRYAIARKNGNEANPPAIIPIIIEGPPPVMPPEELAHLHFNDYLLYLQA